MNNESAASSGALATLQVEEELSMRELFALLWASKSIVLTTALVVFALAFFYVMLVSPTYKVDAIVQVEPEDSSMATMLGAQLGGNLSSLVGAPEQSEAEMAILQSRLVLGQVIDDLNLEIDAAPKYFPIVGKAFVRYRKSPEDPTQLSSPILGMTRFAWGGEKIVVSKLDVPRTLLDERLTLHVTDTGYDLYDPDDEKILSGKVGELATGKSEDGPVSIEVQQLQARPNTRFWAIRYARETVLKDILLDHLKVKEEKKDSGIITIEYLGKDRNLIVQTVRDIEDNYIKQNIARRSEEAAKALAFLQGQIPEVRAKVDEAQAKLNAYQVRKGSVDITAETGNVLQQSVGLEAQRLQLVQQRAEALQRFTPQHPVVVGLDQQIHAIEREQEKVKQRVDLLPESQQQIFSLMRDLNVNTELYTAILDSAQQLDITRAGTIGNARIVDYPLPPFKPAKPKKALTLAAALIFGLFLGSVLVVTQRALLRGVELPEEVEKALGLPTYASIPYSNVQRQISRSPLGNNRVLASVNSSDISIEAIRSLRTSLHFAGLETKNNIIAFTGPSPGLGKSFISLNLGAVLAMAGKKVVVIDADMRRGRLHRYFDMESAPGLSDYVAGDGTLAQVVRPTPIENLSLVCSGTKPPNPAELLLHERFTAFLKTLSEQFDHVLVDTPPVLPVTDAAIIGRSVGATLVVLKAAEHPMGAIEETVRRLRQSGVQVRGVIFNQVGRKVGSYGYKGYGYAYDYSQYK